MKNPDRNYLILPEKIISHAEKFLTNADGLFIAGISSDGIKSKTVVIDDLGDFIPFIGYYNREDLVLRHLHYIEKNKHLIKFVRAFSYTDFLFGLHWYARIGIHAELALSLAEYFKEDVLKLFFKNGFSSYKYYFTLPFFNSLDATYIEIWTEFYRSTKKAEYLDNAVKLSNFLINTDVFKRRGLLSEVIFSNELSFLDGFNPNKRFQSVRIMKNNTSFGFALIDLYKHTRLESVRDAIEMLVDGIEKNAMKEVGVSSHALLNHSARPYLTPSFAVIDMLCDTYQSLRLNKALMLAVKIADFWLQQQSQNTGLFPNEANGSDSYFDSETDMTIALFKLFELTQNQKYFVAAHKTLDGLIKHHIKDSRYVLQVDIQNGKVTDAMEKTKFSLLFLKPFIYLNEGGNIYGNDTLFTLLKDR